MEEKRKPGKNDGWKKVYSDISNIQKWWSQCSNYGALFACTEN